MGMDNTSYKKAVAFHGHSCPGLAMGYRAAKYALSKFGKAGDEEVFAVVENDSCAVDAVQALCSCTFGKGNLQFLDRGKQVFTFFHRKSGKGVRIYVAAPELPARDKLFQEKLSAAIKPTAADKLALRALRERRIKAILSAPDKTVLKISAPRVKLPPPAKIRNSGYCSACGERTMSTRLARRAGALLCVECSERKR